MEQLSDTAMHKRFRAAVGPLLGTWIIRKRRPNNDCTYLAVIPDGRDKERFAILRARDLDLLHVRPATGGDRCRPADLADFCRWQLECGRRGWTADPLRRIAERWSVGHTTLASSRDRLVGLGLLEVVQRSGRRYSDLVWLKELYDPHWQVPSAPELDAERVEATEARSDDLCPDVGRSCVPISAGGVSGLPPVPSPPDGRSRDRISAGPIKYFNRVINRDLTDLGGTSVPPLGLVTREVRAAPPPASRLKNGIGDPHPAGPSNECPDGPPASGVRQARPRFRAAVIARLTAALERG